VAGEIAWIRAVLAYASATFGSPLGRISACSAVAAPVKKSGGSEGLQGKQIKRKKLDSFTIEFRGFF